MKATNSKMIFGEVASQGMARGSAVVCDCTAETPIARHVIDENEVAQEIERFDAAVSAAEEKMLEVQQKTGRENGHDEAAIFEAHIALLHDPSLRETVSALCQTSKLNVEAAVSEAIKTLSAAFARLDNPYFHERAADLRDIGNRLQQALAKDELPSIPDFPNGTVLVTRELLPSVIMQLDEGAVCGMIVEQGGQTAHATILARARGIPMLIRVPNATETIDTGDQIIVDGLAGRVFINATPQIQREYDRLEADLQAHKSALRELIDLPSATQDNTPIKLCANVGKGADAVTAASVNADGVGLYRTEFLFLAQDDFPSEEEQYKMYLATTERLKPREVAIRVLDIGSDKLLSYFPLAWEANPSLGCRGIRLLLAHPEILNIQLRAILRLSATHPVSILFPMVGGLEDLRAAKAAIQRAKAALATEGQPFNPEIRVGAMIETPAAVILAERLAQEVDFLSIGTNDLVQYLLATDRTSSEVAAYYEPLHPAVLAALASVAAVAKKRGVNVSICGEMAGNPAYTKLLIGLGFHNLSVNPGEILEIKNAIRSTNLQAAEKLARQVLKLGTVQEVKERLHETESRGLS
ncbi:MAG: phosphoenolpyruvate--protein phosphotransferase [Kiritimatiellia bacterium]